jgi:drug/metabolite transporter (DMT)-like permease
MIAPSALVILSEVALALYPILIKTVPVNLSTQLVSRFLSFTVLAAIAAPGSLRELWSSSSIGRTAGLGTITLAHVFSSYYAFSLLPAGVAMALFYTYPILNILGGMLFFGESISLLEGIFVLVALVGVGFLAYSTKEETSGSIHIVGVLAGLGAALTETCMYFAVRTSNRKNAFYNTVELYSGALLGMAILAGLGSVGVFGSSGMEGLKISLDGAAWTKMLGFNALIGFIGYVLRFYAIPKMSTVAFSLLSLFGVVASFVWGLVFVSEVPNWISIIGSALIVLSATITDRKE